MNRYEAQNAAFKIDGYFTPPRNAWQVAAAFEAARAECVRHLRAALAHVEAMQLDEFLKARSSSGCTLSVVRAEDPDRDASTTPGPMG